MELIVVRGGGDLASGIAHRLFKTGYKVIITEIEKPVSVRRKVSFSEAVYDGEVEVEGVKGVLARDLEDIRKGLDRGYIPVYVDEKGDIIYKLEPLIVVDAIIAKVNLGTNKQMAPITIGIGPGFEAGVDVDIVVESNRGHYLGKVIHKGKAEEDTGIPGEVLGHKEERVVRASCNGIVRPLYNIGDRVAAGDVVCQVGDREVVAQIDGILRGMIREGLFVHKGLKIGDIDPRNIEEYAFTISDKARAIGGGVLEGIGFLKNKKI